MHLLVLRLVLETIAEVNFKSYLWLYKNNCIIRIIVEKRLIIVKKCIS